MKIEKIIIENFRGFSEKTEIQLNQLNVFIGENDVGKSTILEALDIFFNDGKGSVKIDKEDKNKYCQSGDISITVFFSGYPKEVDIDAGNITSLEAEYLLNSEKLLEIKKEYKGAALKSSISIVANHPTCELGKDSLLKKIKDLKDTVKKNSWSCDNKAKSAELRKSIWKNCGELELKEIDIPIDQEDAKKLWEKIEKFLPTYALFQSDRQNKDSDDEVQDPMKLAVKEVLKEEGLQERLNEIAETVKGQIEKIADDTLEKLKEMNPEIAKTLKPFLPEANQLKWPDVFKNIGIRSDDGISLNKRGSGVKRLVLLNFFRAEAERKQGGKSNLIYAMEEPETSQHPEHQKFLIEAFETLSENSQVLLTTHSPVIVQLLPKESYNLIKKENGSISIIKGEDLFSQNQLALKYASGHISSNEINFLAFDGHVSAEFHTELYSFIENEKKELFDKEISHKADLKKRIKKYSNAKTKNEDFLTIHQYIRHQIHHPENENNTKYTLDELRQSINELRKYLLSEKNSS